MDDSLSMLNRRSVLKSIPATGAFLSVGDLAVAAEDAGGVRLGEFSDGLDGWTTTGGNELTRIGADEMPAGVRVGTHALGVEVNGDQFPMIENSERVTEANFVDHPYVMAHVLGYAEKTDADMVFRFRLHHTHTPAGGQDGSGNDGGGKEVLVEESDEQTVAQLEPRTIRWDLREIDEAKLRTANRLEIVWYIDGHPPETNQRGRGSGAFDYQGLVVMDDIRLTDDVAGQKARASQEKRLALHREHGMVVDRAVDERNQTVERGTLVFADGAEVPYAFEVLEDDEFRYAIDGETFLLGGDGDE